ncbi:hypothetical protein PLEOSDRAFT_1108433 [Pleurotus ostreatus PC15]|uniref:Uncharacterized protein n=1 Tax=Pleurotus ostreatus (strain PC15) TaxID=1137138 RepID=A0A067N803_PLEO1|nr:hypothetical protein PLEOSDRAFT_1108433 [Pleurotus ostreatus PC15]
MPRPRIYHSKADRSAANRAKSARHYAKVEILARRHAGTQVESVESGKNTTKDSQAPQCHPKFQQATRTEAPISHTICLAQRTHRKLAVFINNSPSTFADSLYLQYMKTHEAGEGDTSIIEGPLDRVLRWQQRLDKCGGVILQECGVGKELQAITAVQNTAGVVIEYLQEMLCHAMSDIEAMQAIYKRGRLGFQVGV